MPEKQTPTAATSWEADDPQEALRERFGFADAISAGGWVSAGVLERWGSRSTRASGP